MLEAQTIVRCCCFCQSPSSSCSQSSGRSIPWFQEFHLWVIAWRCSHADCKCFAAKKQAEGILSQTRHDWAKSNVAEQGRQAPVVSTVFCRTLFDQPALCCARIDMNWPLRVFYFCQLPRPEFDNDPARQWGSMWNRRLLLLQCNCMH